MKIARIKKPREFPYNKYTLSDKGYRFIAQIYEDGGGCYEVVKKGKQVYCREDATAEEWIDDLDAELERLSKLREFLDSVRKNEESRD